MTKRDPVTGMTDDELAALADSVREQAADSSLWEDVTVEVRVLTCVPWCPSASGVASWRTSNVRLAPPDNLWLRTSDGRRRPQPGLGVRHGSQTHPAHVNGLWCSITPPVV
jgi:hypothetical protein